ncbi:hypothetical protein JDO7802_00746 [Jannaschia donghaensis]|uniref:Uncharacterized protein n=2 Tax=Jannaschia donghaensis TaxID=420998 RepID=A0A0M6YEG3_9RHOB|nr:hypothetical protein JDO7802_00746 [Jannaschia donghaensis]
MTTIGSIASGPFNRPSPPPPDDSTDPQSEPDAPTDADGPSETGGTAASGPDTVGSEDGTGTGPGTTNGNDTLQNGSSAPPDTSTAVRSDVAQPTVEEARSITLDSVISESQRLDLAFARNLDAALAKRYAEAARLDLISDQMLEELQGGNTSREAFTRDVEALRASEEPQSAETLDRAA